MPRQVAMQLALASVVGEPALDKASAAFRVARLEITVGAGMRGKGIARVALQRALDLCGAAGDIARLDPRPAEIGEEPPILAPMRRQAFEQRQLRLVMVDPATEAEQPENPERQR